jgi:Arc/MetJ-type ribon-helix-helix transcriptional regulator
MYVVAEQKAARRNPTKIISVRIPEFVDRQIEALVELGLFKDRSDFINCALQKALFEMFDKIVISHSEDVIELVLSQKPNAPPDEEIREVIESVEREVNSKFASSGGDRPKYRRVLRVRRADSRSEDCDETTE